MRMLVNEEGAVISMKFDNFDPDKNAEEMAMYERVFGVDKEGSELRFVRGDILGPPDEKKERPVLGFELTARPTDNTVEVVLKEPAEQKKPKKSGKKGK